MDVTPAGMVMAVSALAPKNAFFPMDVTHAGTVAMPVHPLWPLTAMLFVIVNVPLIEHAGVLVAVAMVRPFIRLPTAGYPVAVDLIYAVAPVTPLNALLAITVGLFPKKYTLLRELAFSNALAPMDVTFAGMVMAVSALTPSNALDPMDVTPAGMVMAVRALAFLNASTPMDVSLLPVAKVTVARLFAL